MFFELISHIFPNLIPLQIRNYLTDKDIEGERREMVEFLDESPFVKFKPNTVIRSQGYRGSEEEFIYEWRTDRLGFKNLEKIANKESVDIVAVGDSFTEGMGVATDKTWCSILTVNGYLTYNLGVQGYAPIQLEGSLKKYGLRLNPKYIIIGYCGGTYGREITYFDKNNVIKNRRFGGGIQSIVNAQASGEIRWQARHFISAIYLLTRSKILYDFSTFILKLTHSEIIIKNLRQYKDEILVIENDIYEINKLRQEPEEWNRTLSAFTNIISMAKAINAKVILLYLPHRGEVYYKKVMGKDLPKLYFEGFEAGLLKQFANDNNIIFLNPFDRMVNYVDNLSSYASDDEYPYLKIDGHLNNCGNILVAEEVLTYLRGHEIRMLR